MNAAVLDPPLWIELPAVIAGALRRDLTPAILRERGRRMPDSATEASGRPDEPSAAEGHHLEEER